MRSGQQQSRRCPMGTVLLTIWALRLQTTGPRLLLYTEKNIFNQHFPDNRWFHRGWPSIWREKRLYCSPKWLLCWTLQWYGEKRSLNLELFLPQEMCLSFCKAATGLISSFQTTQTQQTRELSSGTAGERLNPAMFLEIWLRPSKLKR